jgi:hypothetical protein
VGVGLLVLLNLGLYLPRQLAMYHGLYGITAQPRTVLEEANLSNALVIVQDQRGWWDYAVPFSMNNPGLDGDVVYASDCAPHNEELLARYPGRAVYLLDGARLIPYR